MRPHGKGVDVDPRWPRAIGVCDRCGAHWNHWKLKFQTQWQGPRLQNLRILVCPSCLDKPQEQLRTIVIPADPIPILNPRPEAYTDDVNPISGLGTNIGNMTQGGGLAAAFDGNTVKPLWMCANVMAATASFTNTVGKRWNVDAQPVAAEAEDQTVNVTRFTIYAPMDSAFWTLGPVDYAFQGSNDNSTWTTLYNATSAGDIGESIDVTSLTGGEYSYHRINFSGTGGGMIMLAQLVIYGTGLSVQT